MISAASANHLMFRRASQLSPDGRCQVCWISTFILRGDKPLPEGLLFPFITHMQARLRGAVDCRADECMGWYQKRLHSPDCYDMYGQLRGPEYGVITQLCVRAPIEILGILQTSLRHTIGVQLQKHPLIPVKTLAVGGPRAQSPWIIMHLHTGQNATAVEHGNMYLITNFIYWNRFPGRVKQMK